MPNTVPKKQLLETTGWISLWLDFFEFAQKRIDRFADATEDHQFIP